MRNRFQRYFSSLTFIRARDWILEIPRMLDGRKDVIVGEKRIDTTFQPHRNMKKDISARSDEIQLSFW